MGTSVRTAAAAAVCACAFAAPAAHASSCEGVELASVVRITGLRMDKPQSRIVPDPAAGYALHGCEWRVTDGRPGTVVLVHRIAEGTALNVRDAGQMQAMLPFSHPSTITEPLPGVADYGEYAFSRAGRWAGVTLLQREQMVSITAWQVPELGARSREALISVARSVLERGRRARPF